MLVQQVVGIAVEHVDFPESSMLRHIVQCFVFVCMPEHVGCGLNMCDERLNVCISSFIPWSWSKQDLML